MRCRNAPLCSLCAPDSCLLLCSQLSGRAFATLLNEKQQVAKEALSDRFDAIPNTLLDLSFVEKFKKTTMYKEGMELITALQAIPAAFEKAKAAIMAVHNVILTVCFF